jgi:hypothetical protein
MPERNEAVVYRFTLAKGGSRKELEALLLLAVRETELVFGRAQRKLETDYRLSRSKAACTIEGGSECGEYLAKLLSGFLIKQVGEDGFRVERLAQWKKSA